ncbi:VQ motif-containing protein 17-like [Typha angustifolia]|uniref:VQ motif-containing protein 17-like n=1 Tax=Typha angustifolia TaxID=59011 RepID=UPI003C2EF767
MSKPKIRIVHIFAPEIIHTDIDNFRHLVQRLTGKPAGNISGKKRSPPPPPRAADALDEKVKGGEEDEVSRVEWVSGGFLNSLEDGEEDEFFQGLADFSSFSFTSPHVNFSY